MTTQLLIQYGIELFALVTAGIILYIIQTKKPRLVSYLTNTSSFLLPGPPPLVVGTHTIIVENNGRGVAEEIEICHSQLPFINVFPDIIYRIEDTPQGGKIIRIERLLSKQRITISYLYINASNPTVYLPAYTKSKQVDAKIIQTFHSQIPSRWLKWLAGALMLLGLIFIINLIYELVKLII